MGVTGKKLFLKMLRDGGNLIDLTNQEKWVDYNFPTIQQINDLLEEDEEFKKSYESAVKARGDVFFEKAVQVAMEVSKTNAGASKVLIDTLKWAALVSNPNKYGGKPGLLDDKGDGVVIIDTGIANDNHSQLGGDDGGNEKGSRSEGDS